MKRKKCSKITYFWYELENNKKWVPQKLVTFPFKDRGFGEHKYSGLYFCLQLPGFLSQHPLYLNACNAIIALQPPESCCSVAT